MRARILLVPFVAAAALLAGCTTTTPQVNVTPTPTTNGLEAKSADEILDAAIDALGDAKSFRAAGKGESDGQAIEVDLTFAGDNAKGKITFDGATVDVVQADGSAYMKADETFWKMFLPAEVQAMALPLVAGKFVKVPSTESLIPSVEDLLKPEGSVTKGEVTTVDGKPAITIETTDGKLHVSLLGKPYPIDLVSDEGTIKFTDIDADVTITAPPAAEVVDLSGFTS
jgi:hypothetical protein